MNENPTNLIDDLRLLEPWRMPPAWVLALIALALVALVAFLMWRRSAARRAALKAEVAAHAHEDALEALEKARALMSPENSRPYGIEVSGIIRRYIERRYGIFAPRRSTEEFLHEATVSAKLEPVHRALLAQFLGTCDYLKFGRAQAEFTELNAEHNAAVRFVTETRIQPAPAGANAANKPEARS